MGVQAHLFCLLKTKIWYARQAAYLRKIWCKTLACTVSADRAIYCYKDKNDMELNGKKYLCGGIANPVTIPL